MWNNYAWIMMTKCSPMTLQLCNVLSQHKLRDLLCLGDTRALSHREKKMSGSHIPLAGSHENNLTVYVSEMENPSLISCRPSLPCLSLCTLLCQHYCPTSLTHQPHLSFLLRRNPASWYEGITWCKVIGWHRTLLKLLEQLWMELNYPPCRSDMNEQTTYLLGMPALLDYMGIFCNDTQTKHFKTHRLNHWLQHCVNSFGKGLNVTFILMYDII